jgi:hypothetical protein
MDKVHTPITTLLSPCSASAWTYARSPCATEWGFAFSGYHADFHEGHGTVGARLRARPGTCELARHGRGTALWYYVLWTKDNVESSKIGRRASTVRKNVEICGRCVFKGTVSWHGQTKPRTPSSRIATNPIAISAKHSSSSACLVWVPLHAVTRVPWTHWKGQFVHYFQPLSWEI